MFEHGAPWTLVAPDGTTATFNDGGPLVIEEVTGWDSPNIRTRIEDLPQDDGAADSNSYMGQRPWTISGKVNAGSAAVRNQQVLALQTIYQGGLRGRVTAKSTPSGLEPMQVTARTENFRLRGGYVKDFSFAFISADPRAYSQTLQSAQSTGGIGGTGAAWPWAWPVNWGGGTGTTGSVSVTNTGNTASPPLLQVLGPVSNPTIKNVTTGETIYLDNLTLLSGEYVTLDVAAHTAVRNNGVNVYDRVRFPDSRWWKLQPGANVLELRAFTSSAGSRLDIFYRSAWA